MKLFILKNWYRLSVAAAMMMLAFSCLVFAFKYNTAMAGASKLPFRLNKHCEEKSWVVGCGNHIYEVSYNDFLEKYEFKIIGPVQDY
jgi:hypothetical protein